MIATCVSLCGSQCVSHVACHATEALKLTPAMMYAKKLATVWVYESLTARGGGAVIAGLDTSTGRALAVQVNDPTFLDKVRADLARLRRQLGIAENQPDWTTESPEFQV